MEQTKITALYDAYKDPTWKNADAATTAKKGLLDTAFGKLGDLAWFQAVKKRDASKVAYDTATANLKVVTDKIARLTAIMKHMKDTNAADAGSIKDL